VPARPRPTLAPQPSRALLGVGASPASLGGGALVDAELRFGVTVSTDDVARVGQTFVQIRLATTRADGSGAGAALEQRHIEMSIPEFYKLLSALETAQSYVKALE
jgi:COMM domain